MQTLLTKANYDFDTIKEFLRDDLTKVNQIVSKELKTEVSLINDLSEHIISSGGKKIRPIITLISSHVCDYNDDNKHIALAAAVLTKGVCDPLGLDPVVDCNAPLTLVLGNSIT